MDIVQYRHFLVVKIFTYKPSPSSPNVLHFNTPGICFRQLRITFTRFSLSPTLDPQLNLATYF